MYDVTQCSMARGVPWHAVFHGTQCSMARGVQWHAVCVRQLAGRSGGNKVVTAHRQHPARSACRGGGHPGRPSGPHPLLRRLGPHCPTLLSGPALARPVLPHCEGVCHLGLFVYEREPFVCVIVFCLCVCVIGDFFGDRWSRLCIWVIGSCLCDRDLFVCVSLGTLCEKGSCLCVWGELYDTRDGGGGGPVTSLYWAVPWVVVFPSMKDVFFM